MKRYCEKIRDTVAELGPRGLHGDRTAQEHVAGCEDCYVLLEAAAELEAGLDTLEPIDAPDELVASLLEKIDAAGAAGKRRHGGWASAVGAKLEALEELAGSWTLRRAAAVAALFVVVMSGLLWLELPHREPRPADGLAPVTVEEGEPHSLPTSTGGATTEPEAPAPVRERPAGQMARRSLTAPERDLLKRQPAVEPSDLEGAPAAESGSAYGLEDLRFEPPSPAALAGDRPAAITPGKESAGSRSEVDLLETVPVEARDRSVAAQEIFAGGDADQLLAETFYGYRSPDENSGLVDTGRVVGDIGGQIARGEVGEILAGERDRRNRNAELETKKKDDEGEESWRGAKLKNENIESEGDADVFAQAAESVVIGEGPLLGPRGGGVGPIAPDSGERARQAAREFLSELDRVDGLTFQEASGYWANTYVPGDPLLRLLDARLARRDRSAFATVASSPMALHDASRQAVQPFDPPQDSALGVFLDADRAALDGEGRMLVQVGLEATPRRGGRRGAMNLALVLDLRRPVDGENAVALRALLFAFSAARDVGDRFHLVVAGRGGGLVIGPDDFRHGPLAVALEQMLGAQVFDGNVPASQPSDLDRLTSAKASAGPIVDLDTAMERAIDVVTAADDPAAPLGSSAVVVVTAQPLDGTVAHLERLAHVSAVAGVPVSVVGVGEGVERAQLDRVALAGQGTRRLLTRPADAGALAESELTAASRAVARAVRLRIRLAPGVRLVDVLGSRRLDATAADRVREAERSIDRRVARNLGIAADRGEDEEGLQIVIPTFYAGDSHVVLLDVVASGPGPVADVTARFKDLVFLRNGVVRAQLSVERGESARGPLQINVLENLLALRLYGSLEKSGLALAGGDAETASDELVATRDLLAGLALEVRGLGRDDGLRRDLAMLDEYLTLIDTGLDAEGCIHLAESLRLAGRLKVLPRPMALGGGR